MVIIYSPLYEYPRNRALHIRLISYPEVEQTFDYIVPYP